MDVFKKQAKKFTETVANTQQAVFKQFANVTGASSDAGSVIIDQEELERHRELEYLYSATKSAKHFQREVIRSIEGIINANLKHIETITKLSEECRKYGNESPGEETPLGRTALHFASAHSAMERERDLMDRALGTQVGEPLKAMVTGAPLEDARSLTQRYDRLRQEAESLVLELNKRRQKEAEGNSGPENTAKIHAGEEKMKELASGLGILGKEASSAMAAVAQQQQRQSLQRLIAMVEAEKSFHDSASGLLDRLLTQMVAERQRPDSNFLGKAYPGAPRAGGEAGAGPGVGGGAGGSRAGKGSNPFDDDAESMGEEAGPPPPAYEDVAREGSSAKSDFASERDRPSPPDLAAYFLAEVVHSFEAEGPGELGLKAGDYVVVRQVASSGWSEGECRGKAGWFPTDFVERRERVPARKIIDWSGA